MKKVNNLRKRYEYNDKKLSRLQRFKANYYLKQANTNYVKFNNFYKKIQLFIQDIFKGTNDQGSDGIYSEILKDAELLNTIITHQEKSKK